jgi:outer membrane protein TolC
MKISCWLVVCLVGLPVLKAAETDPYVEQLVLPEKLYPQLDTILATAVRQSPRMLSRALDLEVAEAGRIQARANLLPTVGGWGNYFESRDTRADIQGRLDVTKVAYNFSLNQPIFSWGEKRDYATIGKIQQSIAKGQYQEGYRLLAQTLRTDYLKLIIMKKTAQRAAFYLEHSRKQLAQEEDRLAKKVISDYQISAFRLAVEQAQLTSERVQFEYDMAKVSFARLSGSPALTDEAIPDEIPMVKYTMTALTRLLADFLGQKDLPSPDAVTMRKQMESEKFSYAAIKTRLLPKISFTAGVSQDEQSYTINVAQKYRVNSQFAGISGSWTIFDSFSSQAAVRASLARRRQLDINYKDLTETLAQNAQIQVKQLDFSARTMSLFDRGLDAGHSTLKAKQDEFSRGVTAESDVRVAQLGVYDAEIGAFNCRLDFLTRTGDFLALIARDPIVANVAVLVR